MTAEEFIHMVENQEGIYNGLTNDIYVCCARAQLDVNQRKKLLKDKAFVEKYLMCDFIFEVTAEFSEDDTFEFIDEYDFSDEVKAAHIGFFSKEKKFGLLSQGYIKEKTNKLKALTTMSSISDILEFLDANPTFNTDGSIQKHEIVAAYIKNKLLVDKDETVDITDFPKEYKDEFKAHGFEDVNPNVLNYIDLDDSLEDNKGLDDVIKLDPTFFSDEKRIKFKKLCNICPDMKVVNKIGVSLLGINRFESSAKEYLEAEEWIDSVLAKLKPEHSKAQKVAIIDNEIGKKIAFFPKYFEHKKFENPDARALWKVIIDGYGVCNGIANTEHYILNRAGIENELITSENHAFIKLKNFPVKLSDGSEHIVNTLLDPTWNLTAHRFGARPNCFFMSYRTARFMDKDKDGFDSKSHLNNEYAKDARFQMSDNDLRNLFASVGIADKDGSFPIKAMFDELSDIYSKNMDRPKEMISKILGLFPKYCVDFANYPMETMPMMHSLLESAPVKFERCIIDKLYEKGDENQTTCTYLVLESQTLGSLFYVANSKEGRFISLSQKEFEDKYECYEETLEVTNGVKPWEIGKENIKEKNNTPVYNSRLEDKEDDVK